MNASGRDPTWASACGESHRWDGIAKVKERGVTFGRKPRLVPEKVDLIRKLRAEGMTVSHIIRETGFSKASIHRALAGDRRFGRGAIGVNDLP